MRPYKIVRACGSLQPLAFFRAQRLPLFLPALERRFGHNRLSVGFGVIGEQPRHPGQGFERQSALQRITKSDLAYWQPVKIIVVE